MQRPTPELRADGAEPGRRRSLAHDQEKGEAWRGAHMPRPAAVRAALAGGELERPVPAREKPSVPVAESVLGVRSYSAVRGSEPLPGGRAPPPDGSWARQKAEARASNNKAGTRPTNQGHLRHTSGKFVRLATLNGVDVTVVVEVVDVWVIVKLVVTVVVVSVVVVSVVVVEVFVVVVIVVVVVVSSHCNGQVGIECNTL